MHVSSFWKFCFYSLTSEEASMRKQTLSFQKLPLCSQTWDHHLVLRILITAVLQRLIFKTISALIQIEVKFYWVIWYRISRQLFYFLMNTNLALTRLLLYWTTTCQFQFSFLKKENVFCFSYLEFVYMRWFGNTLQTMLIDLIT